jgi:RNA polymerase sigma factor (sigma-70 family)
MFNDREDKLSSLSAGSLVERCIRQEHDAWGEFLRRYAPLILATVVRKLASLGQTNVKSDADDIIQDVFEDLVEDNCRALSSIKDRDRLEPWLCAVALHKTIDFVRKKGRDSRSAATHSYVLEQNATYSHSGPFDEELMERVSEAAKELRPDEQLLLKWFYVHRLKYREIANLARVPINTVSSRLFRIRKKLSVSLNKTEMV